MVMVAGALALAMSALSSVFEGVPAEPGAEPLWRLIVRDIPRDAGAIVVYVLLAGVVALVWWGNRHSGESKTPIGIVDGSGASEPQSSSGTQAGTADERPPPTRGPRRAA